MMWIICLIGIIIANIRGVEVSVDWFYILALLYIGDSIRYVANIFFQDDM